MGMFLNRLRPSHAFGIVTYQVTLAKVNKSVAHGLAEDSIEIPKRGRFMGHC